MADDLTQICEKLDDLLEEFFLEWSKYRGLQDVLSNSMRDGFLHISKSRYSMGVRCVGELQIPDAEFLPLVEARPTEEDDGTTSIQYVKRSTKPPGNNKFQSGNSDASNGEKQHASTISTVRRRTKGLADKGSKTADDEKIALDSLDALAISGSERKNVEAEQAIRDPLKWFGLLVPGSLRHGQKCFQHAAEQACMVASSKMKLENIISEFMDLLQKKRKLKSEVENISSNQV